MIDIKVQWKIVGALALALIAVGIGVAVKNAAISGGHPSDESLASSTAPSLTESVKYSADVAPEVKQILEKSIGDLRTSLAVNYDQYSEWLDLAIRYKMAGDYTKAAKVWEYLAFIHPDDEVARHNLGDLYQNFLHDYAKAEQYYLAAIAAKPEISTDYLALNDLYKVYKQDTGAALTVLKQGSAKVVFPQVIDVDDALASYYREHGDTQNAIATYQKARQEAQRAGDTARVARYDAAIRALEQ